MNPDAHAAPETESHEERPAEYIVGPTAPHTHTIFLLHGLGSNPKAFGRQIIDAHTSLGEKLTDVFPGAKVIFPGAKCLRFSLFPTARVPIWFDKASARDPGYRPETQVAGLKDSAEYILGLMREEARHVPYSKMFLGGLSQGCATSLIVLLTLDRPIGGYIGMSGYLPFQAALQGILDKGRDTNGSEAEVQQHLDPIVNIVKHLRGVLSLPEIENISKEKTAVATPAFMGHGDLDQQIIPSLGKGAAKVLSEAGFTVTWKVYEDLGHWYKVPDEIDDIIAFIRKGLA